jgi:enoyl-CoA hydratase
MTLPTYQTIEIKRDGRRLNVTFNRPDAMNAFNKVMHDELPAALDFARADEGSDVVVLSGHGRAFSAGGDFDHIQHNLDNPAAFDHEIQMAKRIVMTLLSTEKPVICRLNGHAVGLGATIALLCDIIIAADGAKIGDPHVSIGLVAGDGGAVVWAHRIGLSRAKEYLMTGELLTAQRAAEIGLINLCVPAPDLDGAVHAMAARLLAQPQMALRYTKRLTNMELLRTADLVLDQGLEWESETVRSDDHREAIAASRAKRAPQFTGR